MSKSTLEFYYSHTPNDEAKFLADLGTGKAGTNTMSRLSYLLAYRKTLANRTRFDDGMCRETYMRLVNAEIDKLGGARSNMAEHTIARSGRVAAHHLGDSP